MHWNFSGICFVVGFSAGISPPRHFAIAMLFSGSGYSIFVECIAFAYLTNHISMDQESLQAHSDRFRCVFNSYRHIDGNWIFEPLAHSASINLFKEE